MQHGRAARAGRRLGGRPPRVPGGPRRSYTEAQRERRMEQQRQRRMMRRLPENMEPDEVEQEEREEIEERDEGDVQGLLSCFCRRPATNNAAFCASENCSIKEYHHTCVGLPITYDTLANRWLCPVCESLVSFQQQAQQNIQSNQPIPEVFEGAAEDSQLRYPQATPRRIPATSPAPWAMAHSRPSWITNWWNEASWNVFTFKGPRPVAQRCQADTLPPGESTRAERYVGIVCIRINI